MSDPAVQNEIVALANEYRRLQRQLDAKTSQLESLLEINAEAGDFPAADFEGARNRRYSIEFQFTPPPVDAVIFDSRTPPQERSVTIESGTIFRCAYVESFLRAVGTAQDPYLGDGGLVTVQATIPWNDRRKYFDYMWRIRDTGTDREWVDQPQPSWFMGGGYVGPLWLPRRNMLSGGSVLYTTIEPFRNQNTIGEEDGGFFAGGEISQFILQVSFVGHEVPDRSAL